MLKKLKSAWNWFIDPFLYPPGTERPATKAICARVELDEILKQLPQTQFEVQSDNQAMEVISEEEARAILHTTRKIAAEYDTATRITSDPIYTQDLIALTQRLKNTPFKKVS